MSYNVSKRVWCIPDLHLGHAGVEDFCGRPKNYVELVEKNIREMTVPGDIIVFLGDVAFCGHIELWKFMECTWGRTAVLVRGNHDKRSDSWYYRSGFDLVCDTYRFKNMILSHKPVDVTNVELCNGVLNVHAHFHNVSSDKWEPELVEKIKGCHKLVSLEKLKYKPLRLWPDLQSKLLIDTLGKWIDSE